MLMGILLAFVESGKWKVESGSECLAPERDKLNPIKVSQLTMGNKVGG